MNASESALVQSSLSLVEKRFQAIVGGSPSKAWLLHVHDNKSGGTPTIYALADGYNSPGIESKPSTWARLGCPAIGYGVPRFRRGVRLNGSESLKPICDEAARLMMLLPAAIHSRLWRGLPAGTELRAGEGDLLWALAVFELANANIPYSSLLAVRQSPLTEEATKAFFGPESKLPVDPDWYATLPDFAAASVQAIVILQLWLGDELRREAEVESEPPKPVEPQAETLTGGDDTAGGRVEAVVKPANPRPCDKKAWSQYRRAIEDNPELTTDQAAYDWFIEHVADEGESLPAFASWVKYVRLARADAGEQKNKRGVGHETRSVVPAKRL